MPAVRLPIKIGTRGSPLALFQANAVASALTSLFPDVSPADVYEIKVIQTSGDRIQDRRLAELGGKALFTQEIERALSAGEIDIAVHSAKDVETELAPDTVIAAVLPREDRRDALIAGSAVSLHKLPENGTVGTASMRRQAQLLRLRPDLNVVLFRGNVETRLAKLAAGQVDATFLAVAGLNRLGKEEVISAHLDTDEMMPAAGQGAILVQAETRDETLLQALQNMNDPLSAAEVRAERAVLAELGGSCDTPIAAMATGNPAGGLAVSARILRPDGSEMWSASATGMMADAAQIGHEVGYELSKRCDPRLLLDSTSASTGNGR